MNTRILALDISLNRTGWAVVDVREGKMTLVDYGYLPNDKEASTEERLAYVYRSMKQVADKHHPEVWVGEAQFFGNNVKTLMQLSHTHGVLLLLASTYGKRILYYSPQSIKKTVLGGVKLKDEQGNRKTSKQLKQEVEQQVRAYFGDLAFLRPTTDDVFDAVAVAMCYVLNDGKGFLDNQAKSKRKSSKKK